MKNKLKQMFNIKNLNFKNILFFVVFYNNNLIKKLKIIFMYIKK